jgi:hypothetical protein
MKKQQEELWRWLSPWQWLSTNAPLALAKLVDVVSIDMKMTQIQ